MPRTRFQIQRVIGFILGGLMIPALANGSYWQIGTLFSLIFLNIFSAWIRITYKGKDI